MTRTNTVLISVLAMAMMGFAAAPTIASDGYSSVTALTGDPATERSKGSDISSSVTALTGDPAAEQSTPSGDGSSVAALTGDPATERSAQSDGYSSVTALTGDPAAGQSPQSSPSIEVRNESGFDWGDALIGGLIASGLLGLAFVAARSVARHRRAAAEPRV
jgi:hypothetical protein